MAVSDRIRPLLDAALGGSGLLLEDATITPAGRRRVVRVTVDRALDLSGDVTAATAPLTLDEVADATRLVGAALDESDALGEQPYTLEVTSPGVGRPLTEPRHFQRNVGRLLSVTREAGEPVTGRLVRAGAADLTLETPRSGKTPASRTELAYAEVVRAVVEVEFSRGATDPADDAEMES
jgi:ribosome maturation factor RimP